MRRNLHKLNGVSLIVDNEIGKAENINRIIKKIRALGIPTTEFTSLEEAEKCVANFLSINFVILDWNMVTLAQNAPMGVSAGAELASNNQANLIEFIKKLRAVCFAPIFIFTQESQSDIDDKIIPALKAAGLYLDDERRNFICVRNKDAVLKYNRLFSYIHKWVEQSPSIYLLKIWEELFSSSKNKVFWDLYSESNGAWPKILAEHFIKENEPVLPTINSVISQMVFSGMKCGGVSIEKIRKSRLRPQPDEIFKIFKKIKYQSGELLGESLEGIKPGDIFKHNGDYYLNIRPECDTARADSGEKIYLIKGTAVPKSDLKKIKKVKYDSKIGFKCSVAEAFLVLVERDLLIRFNFKKLSLEKFSDYKAKRLCRLLPPYITNIQQRYSSYLGRFGVLRLPESLEEIALKP